MNIAETLDFIGACDNLQQQKIKQLDNAIELGLQQLKKRQKVTARDVYQRIKAKLSVLKSG